METVTRSVALVWKPARYAVQWAYEPGEVPKFDPSRGGDPFAPRVDVQHSDLRVIFSPGATLGGDRPSPDKMQLVDFALGSEQDRGQEAFPNYPRLVRMRTEDVGERLGDNHPLQALAALTRFADDASFMSAARDAAEKFGPLSFAAFSFSLTAWRHTATELHSHMLLLKRLHDIHGSRPARNADVELQAEMRRELLRAVEPLRIEFARPWPFKLHALLNASITLRQVQAGMADLYWSEFRRNLLPDAHEGSHLDAHHRPLHWTQKTLLEVGRPGQLLVRCGSRGWAFYELWQHASRGREIRECQGCGMVFQPRRKDMWHCSDGCRVRRHRRRLARGEDGG